MIFRKIMCKYNLFMLEIENGRDFIFVRHGQTDWGNQDILKGPQDLNLNEIGRTQAEEAYICLSKHITIHNPVIYSSSFRRACETAAIFIEKLPIKVPIIKMDELQERYYGDYGMAKPNSLFEYKPTDAEPLNIFQKRVQKSLFEILKNNTQNSDVIIIFSHQKVFEYLALWLSNKNLKLEHGGTCYFKFKNGVYTTEIYQY
jgi:broad specificity phosphatase PhoE